MSGLFVTLGEDRYRVERPWGDIPADLPGFVSDVACDSRGHVFVLLRRDAITDPGLPTVIELAPDGRRLAAWGAEVMDGHMLACDSQDRILVVDRDAHEVIVFDRGGQRQGGLGTRHRPGAPFNHPCDVAVARDGTIYVADGYGGSVVHRFDANGKLLGSWGEPGDGPGQFTTPHAVWVMADGRVAVADRENNRVQLFSAEGAFESEWRDQYHPMDIWGAGDAIYVTDQTPRLSRYDAAGKLTGRCRPVLNGSHGVWGDAEGNLYCAEMNPSRVTRLVPV